MGRISQLRFALLPIFLAAAFVVILSRQSAQAQTYTVIYSFQSFPNDGFFPIGNLVLSNGYLYGATQFGGSSRNCGSDIGCGTVFSMTTDGKNEMILHSFCGSGTKCNDGELPQAGLTLDAKGNLLGTTCGGGNDCGDGKEGKQCSKGCGNLYSLIRGKEKQDISFGGPSGSEPAAPPLKIGEDIYGTTFSGGQYGGGTLYRIAPDHTVHVLHAFGKGLDGSNPQGTLVADSDDNIYGTTVEGGGGSERVGTVFEYRSNGNYQTLYSFCSQPNCADGTYPYGGLIVDLTGNLYGTTLYGGTGCNQPEGCGTVFKLTGGSETVLHAFADGTDGAFPVAGVVMDGQGNLYGTTEAGAIFNQDGCFGGCGSVFEIAADGAETILHAFNRCTDGAIPFGGVILADGYLYGTASAGSGTCTSDYGVVFSLQLSAPHRAGGHKELQQKRTRTAVTP